MIRLLLGFLITIQAGMAALTTVSGVIQRADGSLPSGSLNISWQAFTNSSGVMIPRGEIRNVPIVNGLVTVSLEPNTAAVPSGTSYRVSYSLFGSAVYQRQWYIPVSSSVVPLVQVEFPIQGLVGTTAIVTPGQLTQSGAGIGQAMCWLGTFWGPGSCGGGGALGAPNISASISGPATNSGSIDITAFAITSQSGLNSIIATCATGTGVSSGQVTGPLTPLDCVLFRDSFTTVHATFTTASNVLISLNASGGAGAQGVSGPVGPVGGVGPAGAQGPSGPPGSSVTGPAGPQGIQGPVGPAGGVGPAGPSSLLSGLLSALPATCVAGVSLYQATDQPYGLQVYACTSTNTWTRVSYSQGASNPGACSVGQIFFNTAAVAGSNLFGCTSTNTFTLLSGGGGGGSTVGFGFSETSSTVRTFGTLCSASLTANPCQVKFGDQIRTVTGVFTATVTGGSGVLYVDMDNAGTLHCGYSGGGFTITGSGCTVDPGISAFPARTFPMFSCVASSGTWNSGGCTDWTTTLAVGYNTTCGIGASCTNTSTGVSVSVPGAGALYQSLASSASPIIDGGSGSVKAISMTLTSNVSSCTVQNFTPGQSVTLYLTQDATGGRTFTCLGIADIGTLSGQATKTETLVLNAVTSSTLQKNGPTSCLQCPPGISIPGLSGGINFLQALPTAGGTQTLTSATGQIPVITGSPVNGHCANIAVSGSIFSLTDAGAACGSGGGGSYSAKQGAVGSTVLSGDTTIYTFASVPALAAGSCYIISGLLSIPVNATIKIAVGGTVVNSPVGGSGIILAYSFSQQYCNNVGVQNAQNISGARSGCYYTVSTPIASSGCTTYGADPTVAASIDWSTSHDITILVNGTGNGVGLNASVN